MFWDTFDNKPPKNTSYGYYPKMLEFQKNAIKMGNEKSLDYLCDFVITRHEKDHVLSRKAQDVLNLILENYQE